MNKEIRNILLFGRTGSGKSTLGNVLVNKNGNFTEVFRESESSVSETKHIQVETFDFEAGDGKIITYRIIDTVGIGDTKLNMEEVLLRIGKIADEVKEGINRILFVTNGRFMEEEAKAFQVLSGILFDEEVFKHAAIVRSNFVNFGSKEKCNEAVKGLMGINQTSFPIISKIDRGDIIFVNNPPPISEEDEIALNARNASRNVLLDYLKKNQGTYNPESIGQLVSNIQKHLDKEKEDKEKAENQVKDLEDRIERIREERRAEQQKADEEMARLRREAEQERDRRNAEHEQAITKIRQEEEQERNRRNAEHEREMTRMREEAEARNRRNAEHEREIARMEREIADLKRNSEGAKQQTNTLIVQEVVKHANEKLTLGGLINASVGMVEQGARTGADIGSQALPLFGTAAGGAIGAGVGFVGALLATATFVFNSLTGK